MKPNNLSVRKEIALKLAFAVHSIHEVGLMHGDLKPGNVLVDIDAFGAVTVRLTDFDSARFINRGSASLYPHQNGKLKFTMEWVGGLDVLNGTPEVLLASLQFDLFSLGLIFAVILRAVCEPSSTALPSERSEVDRLLKDEETLMTHLDCGNHMHTPVVQKFCHLDATQRGTIDDAFDSLRVGATVLHQENQKILKEKQVFQDKVVNKLAKLEVGQAIILKTLQSCFDDVHNQVRDIVKEIGPSSHGLLDQVLQIVKDTYDAVDKQPTQVKDSIERLETRIKHQMNNALRAATDDQRSNLQNLTTQLGKNLHLLTAL